ncbi:hypothetical protein TWF679_006537 [Orbilia oligospora]|uniref:Carboxylesterase type B domain-containing protein n=2 Tax=Orbilia oligospora TaxID=2813651 RepID=A0A8H8V9H6_ORBOL|nr:hypothetical protein TWF679_006537 [Orbilia oligospora]
MHRRVGLLTLQLSNTLISMAIISALIIAFNLSQVLSLSQGVLASPTQKAQSISDLTLSILTDNDLTGKHNNSSSKAVLIESTHSYTDAPGACAQISESLWSPTPQASFSSGLKISLSYQTFLSKYPSSQLFWIASPSCTAIDTLGHSHTVSCHKRLPVLCTNTAPLSNGTFTDNTSPQWHVTRKIGVNGPEIKGYRDQIGFRFFGLRYTPQPARFTQSSVIKYTSNDPEISGLNYPPICLQNMNNVGTLSGFEDCLFLNLWTPYLPGKSASPKNLKPVLFWIHGGGLTQGSANEPAADGGMFSSRGDVVFVAIHYRLGNLGWLGINNVTVPSGEGNGNYGLGDMQTALQWVKENIKYFGGDKNKVTIMGESGGAIAVRALLASKKSKGLVSGAIIQSGAWGAPPEKGEVEYISLQKSVATLAGDIVTRLGCGNLDISDKLACLRTLSTHRIGLGAYANYPLVDSRLLTGSLSTTGKGPGYTVPVPILLGIVRDDIGPFTSMLYGTTNIQDYFDMIGPLLLSEDVSHLAHNPIFSAPPTADAADAAFNISTRIMTDYCFTCLTWSTGYSLAKHKVVPSVYMYEFNRTYMLPFWSPLPCNPPQTPEKPLGDFSKEYYKCHTGELPYTFGTMGYMGMPDRDNGGDTVFMQWMLDLWASFVRTGNPNPNKGFLKARGYLNTISKVEEEGEWKKAVGNTGAKDVRLMQLEGAVMKGYSELEQCEAMGMELEYYD